MKVKEESEKSGLKFNIKTTKLIHVDVWQKTTKFCKAIILQLKNKKRLKIFLKKKKKDCQEK